MNDKFGRKLNYLRISVTDLCNYRCQYCMPENGVEHLKHQDILSFEEMYTIIREFVGFGVTKVRITGGEPLVRHGILNFIESVARLKPIEDLAITTNGSLLKPLAQSLKDRGLHRVNLSLDTLKPDRFKLLTRGGNLQDVLDGLHEAMRVGLKVKINCVLNRGINDDEVDDFIQLTETLGIDVRFIELMPIGDNVNYAITHFVSNESILEAHPELVQIDAEDPSSPAKYYQYKNAKGKVGLISPLSCNFCSHCNRLRITPEGFLKPCLHSDIELDLRTPLRLGESILPVIKEAFAVKPEKHLLEEHKTIIRGMSRIGG